MCARYGIGVAQTSLYLTVRPHILNLQTSLFTCPLRRSSVYIRGSSRILQLLLICAQSSPSF